MVHVACICCQQVPVGLIKHDSNEKQTLVYCYAFAFVLIKIVLMSCLSLNFKYITVIIWDFSM